MSDAAIGTIVVVLGGIALIIGCFWFWVAMLVNAAKHGKWVWFVMVFAFPLLCVLYLLAGHQSGERVERVSYRDDERREPGL